MDISEDFHSAPVPIRLTCQYSNGIICRYYARALACDNRSLKVLSSEPFEKGVSLKVLAPFLKGMVSCRVERAKRSHKQSSFFELELRFVGEPILAPMKAKEVDDETLQMVPKDQEDLIVTAAELANRLEQSIGSRFLLTWQQLPLAQRPLYLVVCISAVFLLLQEKGYLDVRYILGFVNERCRR